MVYINTARENFFCMDKTCKIHGELDDSEILSLFNSKGRQQIVYCNYCIAAGLQKHLTKLGVKPIYSTPFVMEKEPEDVREIDDKGSEGDI